MTLLHIGDHSMLRLSEIPWHLIQPAHLVFLLLALVIGVALFALRGRFAKLARVTRKDTSHDPR